MALGAIVGAIGGITGRIFGGRNKRRQRRHEAAMMAQQIKLAREQRAAAEARAAAELKRTREAGIWHRIRPFLPIIGGAVAIMIIIYMIKRK